jgi:hypothetical protein
MAICIPHLGVAIYTSPKVLSTSLKFLAFQLENGRPFESFTAQGVSIHIHRFYPARPFEPVDREKFPYVFAFVRDPVDRFLSLYRNRVLRKHVHSVHQWDRARSAGLSERPSLDGFIEEFEQYFQLVPEIQHHGACQTQYLGENASFFNRIFSDKTVPGFQKFLEDITGEPVEVPWEQRSSVAGEECSAENRDWIRRHYASDYQTFSQYFAPSGSSVGANRINFEEFDRL